MNKFLLFATLAVVFSSCMKGQNVDLIVYNAKIHTMDENNTIGQAMAIKDGKIVEIGPERQILNKYTSDEEINAKQREVYPGFTDAHGHMMSYARMKLSVDLFGTSSWNDLIIRTEKYQQKFNRKVIVGRGWDQTTMGLNDLPTNDLLNQKFPTTPVVLYRIDGHAVLLNDAALKKAGITPTSQIAGGAVLVKDGKCTGVILDNGIPLVEKIIPDFPKTELTTAFLEVQDELIQYGITGVHEAGVNNKDLNFILDLNAKGKLKLNLYVMLFASEANKLWAKQHGIYQKGMVTVRSFKVMGDGALGSRGALLKKEYHDEHGHFGLLTTSWEEMNEVAALARSIDYQVNIHAIGDSTNRLALELIKTHTKGLNDHRWRIEHAQVMDPRDFKLFSESGAIPSVQPTHAVSDQRWAELRLGKERMSGAYAYKTLLNERGIVALGTDFPVEYPNPFFTIQAAVLRINSAGEPMNGFYPEQALSLQECLQGMTLWAAMAGFSEGREGVLAKEMDATFFIVNFPLKEQTVFADCFADEVVIRGKRVYSVEQID